MDSCSFETTRLVVGPMRAEAERVGVDLAQTIARLLTSRTTVALPDAWRGDYTRERASAWVGEREAGSTTLLVTERSGRPVGLLILAEVPLTETNFDVRIGYLIAEDAWGNGYATELVDGVTGWAAAQDELTSLTGGVDASNRASMRVLEKCGFRRIERNGAALLFQRDVRT